MRLPLIDRYLLREVGLSWLAVTLVLVLIMLANRFSHYLHFAASGDLPANVVGMMVGLTTIRYLIYLIPVSFLLAVMLSFGRLYRDSEMAALAACGVGLRRLYRPILLFAVVLMALTAYLSLGSSPWAARQAQKVYERASQEVKLSLFSPGGFHPLPGDRGVFYAGKRGPDGKTLENVFIRLNDTQQPTVIFAQRGVQRTNAQTGGRAFVLLNGYRVEGQPGQPQFRITHFKEHGVRIAPPTFSYESNDRSERPTATLIGSSDPKDVAELQWRISAPLSVLILAFLAVPLSHINPRQGRYGKVVVGVLLYVIYANLLGVAQTWTADGTVSAALGLWWVHVLFALLAAWLAARRVRAGPLQWWRRRRAEAS